MLCSCKENIHQSPKKIVQLYDNMFIKVKILHSVSSNTYQSLITRKNRKDELLYGFVYWLSNCVNYSSILFPFQ